MLLIFVFPVKNEDTSIGMRKDIYILKRKQYRYRFIVIPSANAFFFLQILTIKYMKSQKSVSRQERMRSFLVLLRRILTFRSGRSPPANLDFQQKIQIGGKEYGG